MGGEGGGGEGGREKGNESYSFFGLLLEVHKDDCRRGEEGGAGQGDPGASGGHRELDVFFVLRLAREGLTLVDGEVEDLRRQFFLVFSWVVFMLSFFRICCYIMVCIMSTPARWFAKARFWGMVGRVLS